MIEWLWPWMALLAPLPWLVRRLVTRRSQPGPGTARTLF